MEILKFLFILFTCGIVLAAGIRQAVEDNNTTPGIIGFVLMLFVGAIFFKIFF